MYKNTFYESNRLDLAEALSRGNVSAQLAGSSLDAYISYVTTVADFNIYKVRYVLIYIQEFFEMLESLL